MFRELGQTPQAASADDEKKPSFSFLKGFFLALISIFLVSASVFFLNKFLAEAAAKNLALSLLLFFLSAVFFVLNAFFIRNVLGSALMVILSVLASLAVFYRHFLEIPSQSSLIIILGAAFLLFMFLSTGIARARSILSNSVRIKFFSVAKPVVAKTFTGFILFTSIIFYLAYFEWGLWSDAIGKKLSDAALLSANPALQVTVPGASFDQPIGILLSKIAENEIQKLKSSKDLRKKIGLGEEFNFDLLAPAEKNKFLHQIAASLKSQIEKNELVGPVKDDERVLDLSYRVLNNFLSNVRDQIGKPLFGFLAALALFVTLKSFSFLFHWLVELFAFIVFKILLASGFAYISFENAKKETIVM